jgi:methionyl aminopeptidase
MPVLLKSPTEIERMRAAGAIVAEVHARLRHLVAPGVTTRELDSAAHELIVGAGGWPAFLGYRGFPASACVSVNEVVLHGIPGERQLTAGDIVSIDIGVRLDGFFADGAITLPVGQISEAATRLIEVTERCFWIGFEQLRIASRLGDVAARIQQHAEACGMSVVREYTGHGVGRQMHEDPSVPNYGEPGTGSLIRNGMTIALEPMICLGEPDTRVEPDGWTVVTIDGSLAAHYEHTVAIVDHEPLILTAPATAGVI